MTSVFPVSSGRRWPTSAGGRLGLILVLAAAVPVRAALLDMSAPLTGVSANYDGFQMVCRVTDPAQGKEYVDQTVSPTVFGFNNTGGVVSWTSGNTVFVRTYDPAVTNWVRLDVPVAQVQDVRGHRGLVAWSSVGNVGYTVYDQARHQWRTEAVPSSTMDLRCVDGVVSWTSGNGIFLRTYDPALGVWQKQDVAGGPTFDLSNTNGVVAWSGANAVRARTYDPLRGAWSGQDIAGSPLTLGNDSSLVAWSTGSWLFAQLYHPLSHQWLSTSGRPLSGTVILMGITNATATWSDGFNVSQLGYNFATTNWQASPTSPLAGFAVSTNAGPPPLTVYFTDLSVAGLARTWTFGDGVTNTMRSPLHTFTGVGRYTVTQTIVGHGATVSFTTNILTDVEPPAGMVTINGGASFTTNRNVTLTLGASDNSGTVAQMRLSNDGTTWNDWQPFATNQDWQLPAGVTTRFVYAQFQDPYGNVSAVVNDSIYLDTTPPPPVRFAVTETNVLEANRTLTMAVNLDYPMSRQVSVDYATQDLTATAGSDYTAASGTLIFQPGTTNRTISLTIKDDTLVELDEQFQVAFLNPVDVVPGPPLTVTILDNDFPAVAFSGDRFTVGEGDGTASAEVRLSAPSGQAVSVAYTVTNGTATAGLDFVAMTGVLEFSPGQTAKTIAVPILDDTLDETTETVLLKLSSPTNAVLGTPATATLEILDNDPPTVNFGSADYPVGESAGSVTVEVGLSKSYGQTIYVDYATGGGTATAGQDYVPTTGTLIFAPGQTNRTFLVTILPDSKADPEETIGLHLSGYVNVTPGTRVQATVTIVDDDSFWLTGLGFTETGAFRLRITGPAGGRALLQTSPDLNQWSDLKTLNNPTGVTEYEDTAAVGNEVRYYRVRSAP